MSAVGIGIIGVGVISDTYLENLASFPDVEVLIVGDLLPRPGGVAGEEAQGAGVGLGRGRAGPPRR